VVATTGKKGRWQKLGSSPRVYCDTGHNAHGLREVVAQIQAQDYRKLYMVVGMVSDKDFDSVIPLMPRDAHYIFTAPSVPRALPAETLAEKFLAEGFEGEVALDVHAAYRRAIELADPEEDFIFVGGSTFVVADLLSE
jgi:dihydrofolate synthase/folylpolyglutamate synthase